MKPRQIVLLLLAVSIGPFSACSSPPVATTHDGIAMVKKEAAHVTFAAPSATFAFEPCMYSVTGIVTIDQQVAVVSVPAAVSTTVSTQNCSKPQRTGLAIRKRGRSGLSVINILVAATSGHRLLNLHVDPGLCG